MRASDFLNAEVTRSLHDWVRGAGGLMVRSHRRLSDRWANGYDMENPVGDDGHVRIVLPACVADAGAVPWFQEEEEQAEPNWLLVVRSRGGSVIQTYPSSELWEGGRRLVAFTHGQTYATEEMMESASGRAWEDADNSWSIESDSEFGTWKVRCLVELMSKGPVLLWNGVNPDMLHGLACAAAHESMIPVAAFANTLRDAVSWMEQQYTDSEELKRWMEAMRCTTEALGSTNREDIARRWTTSPDYDIARRIGEGQARRRARIMEICRKQAEKEAEIMANVRPLDEAFKQALDERLVSSIELRDEGHTFEFRMDRLYFQQEYEVEVGNNVFEAGTYEVPEVRMLIPTTGDMQYLRCLNEDDDRHPHPHIMNEGKVCWGEGEETLLHMEMAQRLFLHDPYEFFVFMRGYFLSFTDNGEYEPLVAVSERVGDVDIDVEAIEGAA